MTDLSKVSLEHALEFLQVQGYRRVSYNGSYFPVAADGSRYTVLCVPSWEIYDVECCRDHGYIMCCYDDIGPAMSLVGSICCSGNYVAVGLYEWNEPIAAEKIRNMHFTVPYGDDP